MQKYIAIDDKRMKKSTRIAAIVGGLGLIALGIYMSSLYTGVIGAVLLLALVLQKEFSVTEEGVIVTYDAIVYKYREVWPFEDIVNIHKELSPDGKHYAVHFGKDVMSRRLIFPKDVADDVIRLAMEKNPSIYFGEVDK